MFTATGQIDMRSVWVFLMAKKIMQVGLATSGGASS
tara:strand:- start:419 stop:526 length:108 start_codon:yes stop_codon:yes gene_type:complete